METPSINRITVAFVLTLVLLMVNAAVSYLTLTKLVDANQLVVDTERTVKLLGDLRTCVIDAESSVRDFVITGEIRHLDPFLAARPLVTAKLKDAAPLAANDPGQVAALQLLGNLLEQRFEFLNEVVLTSKNMKGPSLAELLRTDHSRGVMVRIRGTIDQLQNRQQVALASRAAESERHAYISTVTNLVSTFINVCLLGGLLLLIRRDAVTRRTSAVAARNFSEQLARSLAEVRQRNEEITVLNQLSSFLQTCATSEEACVAIARFGSLLFPTECGAIYLFHASRNYLELVASWGKNGSAVASEELFAPADCWGLRRGCMHAVNPEGTAMVCAHIARKSAVNRPYLCAPMMAQGETIGLLSLQPRSDSGKEAAMGEAKLKLATVVAEQIALSLSNIVLRETLRQQSVRDPLTGLYNRRYLEETLDRELSRLERRSLPLALIMMDVDNFKIFNDTFGHEAGDAVLRDLGGVLQRYVRGSDIACRYGGEEFTVILPEADIEIARQRAEMLRAAVHELHLVHNGKSLGAVTLSLGVACFPEHGRHREALLKAADTALYEAKNGGRNRVVISNTKTLRVVPNPPQRDQDGH